MSDAKGEARTGNGRTGEARTGEVRSERWIEAGLAEIARSGVEGVRVEVLAKNLGVTKGGFYRRFRDRAALLEARPACRRMRPMRRRSCSTASSSARACCSSNAARASARN